MWTIDVSLFDEWLLTLDDNSLGQIYAALEILDDLGPGLGRPLIDTVTASRHRNIDELRPGSVGRDEMRILFSFAPEQKAILLVAGDKAGDWHRWYKRKFPRC